jgi:uncharacterized protein DUF4154
VNGTAPNRQLARALRRGAVLLCVLGALAFRLPAQIGGAPGEYDVEAAFLVNFTKFTEWPPLAFADSTSALSICVLGEDPFGAVLDQLTEGESVNGRKLAVQRIRRTPAPKSCQVLFIGKDEKNLPALIAEIGPGVLTVSDRERFLQEGGIIAFMVQDRHVRFDISQRAAAKASLTISARLLSVARSVQK